MYVNGYYSEWFGIKSGVAQGCPLSPLLFLVVAQALKIALFNEKKLKDITINGVTFKVVQFADDTTVFMTDIKEVKAATSAINKWCEAKGMRENIKKRRPRHGQIQSARTETWHQKGARGRMVPGARGAPRK